VATLYEHYNENDDMVIACYSSVWEAQTFTVGEAGHPVTSVKIKAYRIGSPGTLTLSIRNVDGDGKPTGDDLTSGTADADGFTEDSSGAWYEISITEYELEASTQYAIVMRCPDGDISNLAELRMDYTSSTYDGGQLLVGVSSGGTWYSLATCDLMFEVWGEDGGVPADGGVTDPKLTLLELLEGGCSLGYEPTFSADWLQEKAEFPQVVVSHVLTTPRHVGFSEDPAAAKRRFEAVYLVDVWAKGDAEQREELLGEMDSILHSKCNSPGGGLEYLKVSAWRDLDEGGLRPPLFRSQTRVEVLYYG
jgi:hypothetical protein